MSFSKFLIEFHKNIVPPTLSEGISWINPYDNDEAVRCMTGFYKGYYTSNADRRFWFGINPGRLGAGITGIPFTDPVVLEDNMGIPNSFAKRQELSAQFIYEVTSSLPSFYDSNYITSVCPLGLLKDNKNYNYYDDKQTLSTLRPFIVDSIEKQLNVGYDDEIAMCIGKGKNLAYLTELNDEFKWFNKVVGIVHPRWVMQYNRKEKQKYIDVYKGYAL